MNDKWLKQYKDNYNGKSEEAKEIADFLKETYNGASYIPWATMERLTYMQDPNAEFKTILNDANFDGNTLVHTDSFRNENLVEGKDGVVSHTDALVVSHFVKVSCTFMGKTFIEEYPIQEQDYSAAKIYNQNLVNKALKRALAKVASRATGLGLKLYENKDLQFDEVVEEKKPEVKKTTKKVEPKEETTVVTVEPTNVTTNQIDTTGVTVASIENATYTSAVTDLCKLIKETDKDKMNKVLQSINVSVLKKYGYALSTEDTDNDLCEKLSKFENIETFTRAINTMLG